MADTRKSVAGQHTCPAGSDYATEIEERRAGVKAVLVLPTATPALILKGLA
jgi:hypothetical protein